MLDFVTLAYSGFEDRFVAKVKAPFADELQYPIYCYAATDNNGLTNGPAATSVIHAHSMLENPDQGNGDEIALSEKLLNILRMIQSTPLSH